MFQLSKSLDAILFVGLEDTAVAARGLVGFKAGTLIRNVRHVPRSDGDGYGDSFMGGRWYFDHSIDGGKTWDLGLSESEPV